MGVNINSNNSVESLAVREIKLMFDNFTSFLILVYVLKLTFLALCDWGMNELETWIRVCVVIHVEVCSSSRVCVSRIIEFDVSELRIIWKEKKNELCKKERVPASVLELLVSVS